MTVLKVGGYAKIGADEDIRNIGKEVNLYAYHEKYTASNGTTYYNTWLFDCNEGFYVNGNLRYTMIGTDQQTKLEPLCAE